MQVCVWTTVLI